MTDVAVTTGSDASVWSGAEYSPNFFASRSQQSDQDAMYLIPDIIGAIGKCPESVIDFGCGDGSWLRWFREAGATSLVGVDLYGPEDWMQGRGLHLRLDLTKPIDLGHRAELVVCVEVAEHLPEEAADQLVANLVVHGDRIVFSAAPPGQGGTDHVNEQPIEYWQRKFAAHGYEFQDLFRHRIFDAVSLWFRTNLFLVAKPDRLVRMPQCKITTARYRDSFREVDDAIAELRHDPRLIRGCAAGGNEIGVFSHPHGWRLLDDIAILDSGDIDPATDAGHAAIKRWRSKLESEYVCQKSRLIHDVYRSVSFGAHELGFSAVVDKMRSQLASESLDMHEWNGVEYSLWIDADSVFRPQQAIDLVVACHENDWEICTGVYTTKEKNARIVHKVPKGYEGPAIGPYARPYMVPGIGFGFVVVKHSAYRKLISRIDPDTLHRTWFSDGTFSWDLFRPRLAEPNLSMIDPATGIAARAYWNEDYSFTQMTEEVGIQTWVLPQVVVKHRGRMDFGIDNLQHLSEGK